MTKTPGQVALDAYLKAKSRPNYEDPFAPLQTAVAAAIAHHEAEQWQPMKDAPQDGSEILAASYGDPDSIVVHWHDGSENYHGRAGWYADYAHLTARPVTVEIWRPLPVSPERKPE